MEKEANIMIGLGEVLWEKGPESKRFGGGPATFAYYATLLGNRGIVASKVGADELGTEMVENFKKLGVEADFVQTDELAPTGTITVEPDPKGEVTYTINEEVAWDYFDWDDKWETLASQASLICFNSLSQRGPQSYHAIRRFLRAASRDCVRIFDVHLRDSYYCVEKLNESMLMADVVKLSESQLPQIFRVLGLKTGNLRACAKLLQENYGLKMLVLTRGQRGCMLVNENQVVEHPGFKIKQVDEMGAGDAFAAVIGHHFLRGTPLDKMAEAANRLAAFVASRQGTMVEVDRNTLNLVTATGGKKQNGRPNGRGDDRRGGRQ